VVSYDPLPELPADPVQLAQVFQNLIGNALKFRSQAAPRIHVGATERTGDWEIEVRDNGIGIEPQYFERIFMVFQRLHNKGEYPGTGIGLAIVKKVIERHGGLVRVESRPGAGSAFIFTLPKTVEGGS
jgi:light-regulated signal transduction histidine kinase (bacteriophytochrome)